MNARILRIDCGCENIFILCDDIVPMNNSTRGIFINPRHGVANKSHITGASLVVC
jgi:hypothetical protein